MKKVAILFLIITIQFSVLAQDDLEKNPLNSNILSLSAGISNISFRDYATSPLFYSGYGNDIGANWHNINKRRNICIGVGRLHANTIANTPKSNYFQTFSFSSLTKHYIHLSYLHNIPHFTTNKMNIKSGATLSGIHNNRITPVLLNSQRGLESFVNVALSTKAELDISRNNNKTLDLLLFKIHQKPIKRIVSFQIDIGLINFNHRPSYNYSYLNKIDGVNNNNILWELDSYIWSLNGWKIGTALELCKYKPNGNGHKIAYTWDALNAPGKYKAFELGIHQIKYALLFNLNY